MKRAGIFDQKVRTVALDDLSRIAFYGLGIGLRSHQVKKYDIRGQLSFVPSPMDDPARRLGYRKDADGRIFLFADGVEIETELTEIPVGHVFDRKEANGEIYLATAVTRKTPFKAPTEVLVRQLASMIIAFRNHSPSIVEGLPGGGKTVSVPFKTHPLASGPWGIAWFSRYRTFSRKADKQAT